jgi:hypothetical protein
MILENVRVKRDTRNHKGFFVLEASYKLVNIDGNGWALICLDDYACHYVDPDDLKLPRGWKRTTSNEVVNA